MQASQGPCDLTDPMMLEVSMTEKKCVEFVTRLSGRFAVQSPEVLEQGYAIWREELYAFPCDWYAILLKVIIFHCSKAVYLISFSYS